MSKMLHFAWFGAAGAHYWNLPPAETYAGRAGALYMNIARLCEEAFLDMVLFADIPAIPTAFGGNNDHYVKYGFEAHLDPDTAAGDDGRRDPASGPWRHAVNKPVSAVPVGKDGRHAGPSDRGAHGVERRHILQRGRGPELWPGRPARASHQVR